MKFNTHMENSNDGIFYVIATICINKHKLLSAFGIFCCEMMLVCKDFTHCLFQFI